MGGYARARTWAIDFTPLRHRDYRLLFFGQGISFVGSMITYVAIPYEVFHLTRSSLDVGLLGLAEVVPLVVTALIGGLLADARERRRMVRFTELGLLCTSATLLVAGTHLAVLYIVAFVASALDGIQRPSLDAMVPRLVSHDELPAASALTGLKGTVGMIGGPALAGLLLVSIGLRATFAVDVASFAASLTALARMRAVPPPPSVEAPSLQRIAEGFRYARSRQELLGSYLIDMNAMFFGMPTALFPALAIRVHGGPGALGLLYAAPAAGAGLANLVSGWTGRVARHGRAIILAAIGWGLAITAFGLVRALMPALLLLAIAGAADMVSGLFRMTLWNQTIPDPLRGRLAGIEMISYASGPNLGNVEAGVVASFAGAPTSIVSGGLLCVLGSVLIAWRLPGMRTYSTGKQPQPEQPQPD